MFIFSIACMILCIGGGGGTESILSIELYQNKNVLINVSNVNVFICSPTMRQMY